MSIDNVKFCRGNFDNIDKAIADGLINANDIVITKDTHEFVYINSDGTKDIISGQIKSYESKDDAISILNALASTKAGQVVTIKNDEGKYIPYIVQKNGDGFTVEPVTAEVDSGGVFWSQI